MKSRLFQSSALALCLFCSGRLFAEDAVPPPSPEQSEHLSVRPPEQLDQLFGPIALYPDALVALILPASTVPSDIVLAARYVAGNGDPAKADDETWDDSVKALVHYPDIIKWMDENLAWTKQAGEAFASQPADVMNSIQRLRTRARAAGTLVDTPQQQMVMEDDNISIVPAQPDVIYVPSYDPDIVYISHPGYSDPFLTFGVGYAAGFWLGYDFDWGRRRIWTIDRRDRERYWHDHHDWRRPSFPGRPGYSNEHFHQQPWRPRPNYQRPRPSNNNQRQEIARPVPFPNGGSNRPHDVQRGGADAKPGDRDHRRDSDNRGPQPNRRPESARPAPESAVQPPATVPSPSTTNTVRPQAATPPRVPQRPHEEREHRPNESARTSPVNSIPQPQVTSTPAPITNIRSQPAPSTTPQRNREDHEVHGRDRREAQSVPATATPQGRVAPVQSAPPPRSQAPVAVQSRPQQSVQPQASRSEASSQSAKSDKDNRSDRSSRQ